VTDVITSDGVRLYAEATGSGLPVLFIPEFAADHRTWSRQVDALGAKQAMGPNRIQLPRKHRQVWEEFAGHSAEGMALTVTGIQRSRPSLYDITHQLAGITAPTLVVNGDEDEACLEPGLLLKRTIPKAGLAVVPNSGHILNLEEPELFNDLIRTLVGLARDPLSLSASMGIVPR
jgi:pimeloyl-ACP methyl ester carboxylesterase